MIVEWLSQGYSEELFWNLTPVRTNQHSRAAIKRDRHRINMGLSQAWHNAKLQRAKEVPDLNAILMKDRTPISEAEHEEMFASKVDRLFASLPDCEPKEDAAE